MIDPITNLILEAEEEKLKEEALDTILEGYDLSCQACGRVVKIMKDGQGPLACCNQRMFVMGSNPVDPAQDLEECDADFSPYNQSEVQKKTEEERDKRKNAPYNKSPLVKEMEVFDVKKK